MIKEKLKKVSALKGIINKKAINKILSIVAKNKDTSINKIEVSLLEFSEVGISLEKLYFIKFLCLILCFVLLIIICYTNVVYKKHLIINEPVLKKNEFFYRSSYEQPDYSLYKYIMNGIGESKLKNATNEDDRHYIVEKEISEYFNTSDIHFIENKTEWFLNTWRKIETLKVFDYYHIIFIALSFYIPEVFLIFRGILRDCAYKKEVVKLEYILDLLSSVDGINTFEIISELEKASKSYSKYLHEFSKIFRYDKKKGFEYLRSKNIKSLSKIANVLEIYSLSNKDIAMQILEREVMERDESILITADETIDFVDLIAFLSIVPLIYELARLMLNPMIDMVYRAFEFF